MLTYGTYRVSKDIVQNCIEAAVDAGITRIDTAALYRNDVEALSAARRHANVYITSKISKKLIADATRDNRAIEEYARLGWDCVLVHMPTSGYEIAWEQLRRVDNIDVGVSNFTPENIAALSSKPQINQIEVTPYNDCKETVEYCMKNSIAISSHSTLTKKEKFGDTSLQEACREYDCTAATYLLNWSRASGYIPIFSSSNVEHIRENASTYGLTVEPVSWHCTYRTHPQYKC
jgi:diketogulonate reductase-like aldo/keto reductase